MAGGLERRSRVECFDHARGSTAAGHQFCGGSFMSSPPMMIPTVMMTPVMMMNCRIAPGLSAADPTPEPEVKPDTPPIATMKGTEPYAQAPFTNPVLHPFFSGYHFDTMLTQPL